MSATRTFAESKGFEPLHHFTMSWLSGPAHYQLCQLSICVSDWIQTNSVLQQQIYSLLRLFNFAALTIEDKERLELSTIGLTSHRSAIELFIHFVFFNSSFLIPHFLFLIPVGRVRLELTTLRLKAGYSRH